MHSHIHNLSTHQVGPKILHVESSLTLIHDSDDMKSRFSYLTLLSFSNCWNDSTRLQILISRGTIVDGESLLDSFGVYAHGLSDYLSDNNASCLPLELISDANESHRPECNFYPLSKRIAFVDSKICLFPLTSTSSTSQR